MSNRKVCRLCEREKNGRCSLKNETVKLTKRRCCNHFVLDQIKEKEFITYKNSFAPIVRKPLPDFYYEAIESVNMLNNLHGVPNKNVELCIANRIIRFFD